MKDKNTVRYLGFRSAIDGGRLFDFSVVGANSSSFQASIEIPLRFFSGVDRVRFQEGVGICYAKLKHLLETDPSGTLPTVTCLTASDLEQYRERPARNKYGTYGTTTN